MFKKDPENYSLIIIEKAISQLEEELKNTSQYPVLNKHGLISAYEIARRVIAEYKKIDIQRLTFQHAQTLHQRLLDGIAIPEYKKILDLLVQMDAKAEPMRAKGVADNLAAASAANTPLARPVELAILSTEPKTKAEFEQYGKKAYEVRKTNPDEINLRYLALAAINSVEAAKMVMTCSLCNKLSSADLIGIIKAHRHDDRFMKFIKSPQQNNIQPKVLLIILKMAKHNAEQEAHHHRHAADEKHGMDPNLKAALKEMNKNLIEVLKEFKKKDLNPYVILDIQDENSDDKAVDKACKNKLLDVHPDRHVNTIQNDPAKAGYYRAQADLAAKARDLLKDPNAKKFFKPPQQSAAAASKQPSKS